MKITSKGFFSFYAGEEVRDGGFFGGKEKNSCFVPLKKRGLVGNSPDKAKLKLRGGGFP